MEMKDKLSKPHPAAPHSRKSNHEAARLALGYMISCALYILLSSQAVTFFAHDISEAAGFEMGKGLAFVVISGLVFYLFAKRVFYRLAVKEHEMLLSENLLIQTERKAMASMLAASVAHDMNNILTIVGYGVNNLASSLPPEQRKDTAAMTEEALREMAALAHRLMSLGNEKHADDFKTIDLLETVHSSIDVARMHILIRSCTISITGEPGTTLLASPRLIASALLNLLLNSADATKGEGQIEVRVARTANGMPSIEVDDNGPGIAPDIRDRLFTAFATNKVNGTGLGLLSVKGVALAHLGSLALVPSRLGGACFRMTFPLPADSEMR